jgi:hypothetical protein
MRSSTSVDLSAMPRPRSVESYRRILWKLAEEYAEIDPAAVLRRPKKRRADVYARASTS